MCCVVLLHEVWVKTPGCYTLGHRLPIYRTDRQTDRQTRLSCSARLPIISIRILLPNLFQRASNSHIHNKTPCLSECPAGCIFENGRWQTRGGRWSIVPYRTIRLWFGAWCVVVLCIERAGAWYIYMYIYRERGREREKGRGLKLKFSPSLIGTWTCIYSSSTGAGGHYHGTIQYSAGIAAIHPPTPLLCYT